MSTKTFHGSCFCKAIRFEADIDFTTTTTGKCNCTSCWKRRWWSIQVKPDRFRSIAGDGTLSKGRTGFCPTCGVIPYGWVEKAEWNDGEYVSVNVAALDDLDPRELMEAKVQYYDGRNDAWQNPPAFTGHL